MPSRKNASAVSSMAFFCFSRCSTPYRLRSSPVSFTSPLDWTVFKVPAVLSSVLTGRFFSFSISSCSLRDSSYFSAAIFWAAAPLARSCMDLMKASVLSTSRFSASATLATATFSLSNSSLFSVMNFFFAERSFPREAHFSCKVLSDTRFFPIPVSDSCIALFNSSCASARPATDFFPEKSVEKKFPISLPNTTVSVMAVAIKVCHEKRDESTCFHTGVAFWPAAVSLSYSFLALPTASVNIGMLLDIARKNICGPMASDGSSRAICAMLIFTLFSFGAGSLPMTGVSPARFLAASYSLSCSFNPPMVPFSAWMSAISLSPASPCFWRFLYSFSKSFSSSFRCPIIRLVKASMLATLPSTDLMPASVLSSRNISSLMGFISVFLLVKQLL